MRGLKIMVRLKFLVIMVRDFLLFYVVIGMKV